MQTDPNWTNFLWNHQTRQVVLVLSDIISLLIYTVQIELVDFGATREYTKDFIDMWLHLLQAAATDDRGACIEWSLRLGYITGEESEVRRVITSQHYGS
jgi:aarF domain-containing kinase